jgi:hypothetical protein
MLQLFKKIITLLILASFLAIVFFGITVMIHGPEGGLSADCPLSSMGDSTCPQDILSASVHHLSAYYSFFNVPVSSTILTLVLFMFFVAVIFLKTSIGSLQLNSPPSAHFLLSPPFFTPYSRKINHWLSLLENSPSSY